MIRGLLPNDKVRITARIDDWYKTYRIIAKEEARKRAKDYFPEIQDKYTTQIEAYKIMPDDELFEFMDVELDISPEDLPGRPLRRVKCDLCAEYIQDSREIVTSGGIFCKSCAEGSYYRLVDNKSGKNFY